MPADHMNPQFEGRIYKRQYQQDRLQIVALDGDEYVCAIIGEGNGAGGTRVTHDVLMGNLESDAWVEVAET